MSHDKQTRIIFALVTFSWATSWFFAKMQIAFVPQEMSVCYRFFLAGIILIFYSILTKKNFKFSQKEYLLIGIQAVCVFSVNHLFFYQAMHYISSGVVAALFSLSIILSAIFNFLFYQEKTDSKIIIGGGIGIIGLGLIFAGDFQKIGFNFDLIKGAFFALVGVTLFSISASFTQHQGPSKDLISKTSLAMILGSLIALAVAFSKNEHFVFDSSPKYIFSLAYLVLIPGIVGFVGILHLISKIGSSKAAYTSLIYPVGALAISAMFENYHFGLISIFGLVMIIAGNYLALRSKK